MSKLKTLATLFMALCFSAGAAQASLLDAIKNKMLMKQNAGTYISSSTTADLEESVIWVLSADGTCFATYTTLNLNPVDASFSPGIGEASCGWEIIGENNGVVQVKAFFLEYARDPDNVLFANDDCSPACVIYGVTAGPIQNGVWTQEETAGFIDLNLDPISSSLFGDYLLRPYGINVLEKFDVQKAVNNLENINAPVPDGLP